MKTNLINTILALTITLPAGIHRLNIHGTSTTGAWIVTTAPRLQTSHGWTVSVESAGAITRESVGQAELIADEYLSNPA